ncbi:IS3 family transposase [Nonomuraea sp. NPDC049421]|uniref:IS3 family transposase n=1 Tax=Nonomuraea sp. NPDC049421 TaxID=3155275 RepID=UPI0034453A58
MAWDDGATRLTSLIRQIHQDSRGTYGARQVHAELTLGHQVTVSHEAVEPLMRRAGPEGLSGRPKWRRARPDQIATDLVDRAFTRTGPNQLWITDITEHPNPRGQGVLLHSAGRLLPPGGRLVHRLPQTATLVTSALGMAIDNRTPPAGTIIHSGQGVQLGS